MTMKEKLKIHAEIERELDEMVLFSKIERENKRKLEEWKEEKK